MKPEWMKFLPVWGPAAEGGSGGDGGEAAPPGDAAVAGEGEGAANPPGGEGGAEDPPPARSSIMDFAPKDGGNKDGTPEGDAWKMPDGLELPEHLVGESAEATLAKLAPAYRGARQELSTRKKEDGVLEGSVPKDGDGYTFEAIEADPAKDAVLADLTSEESKPYLKPFQDMAHELGIPDATFAKFMHGAVSKLGENGLSIVTDPEEAMKINGEAEMEALTTELGPQGADQALRQLDTFAVKLANNGILSSQEDVNEFAQMIGTAKGAQIMQRIIVAEFGEQAIPPADPVDGAPTIEEAYTQHREALSMGPGSDREAAVAAAEKAIERAMAESSTPGQIRSRVL